MFKATNGAILSNVSEEWAKKAEEAGEGVMITMDWKPLTVEVKEKKEEVVKVTPRKNDFKKAFKSKK